MYNWKKKIFLFKISGYKTLPYGGMTNLAFADSRTEVNLIKLLVLLRHKACIK